MASRPENLSLEAFTAALRDDAPPAGLDNALQALWHEARAGGPGATRSLDITGEMSSGWKTAHGLSQRQRDKDGSWVHAYLHWIEGDDANAGHWYERAGRPFPTASLADEWAQIAAALLVR
jgi:hypothetical protein